CIDLDGFHDGAVRRNTCVNGRRAEDYPYGSLGIIMNDTYPGVRPDRIEISGNRIAGTKFGALFLIGSDNRVMDNTFENLNTAGCNESELKFGCIFKLDEPRRLEAGIYLGRGG